jgi:hypothetical protein
MANYTYKDFEQLVKWGEKAKAPKAPIASMMNEIQAAPYGDRMTAGDGQYGTGGYGIVTASKRPENLLRDAVTSGLNYGTLVVRWDSSFQTGCWTWDEVLDRHKVTVGGGFGAALRSDLTRKQMLAAYRSLLRHETWHGIATLSPGLVLDELRRRGLPFPLHNQFEDIRIEHLARTNDDGIDKRGKFNWARYIKMPSKFDSAVNYLNALSTAELSVNYASKKGKLRSMWQIKEANKKLLALCNYNWTGAKPVTIALSDGIRLAHHTPVRRGYKVETRALIGEFAIPDLIHRFYMTACYAKSALEICDLVELWTRVFGTGSGSGHKVTGTINGETSDGEEGDYSNDGEVPLETWIESADADPANANPDEEDGITQTTKDLGKDPTSDNVNPATGKCYPSAIIQDNPDAARLTDSELADYRVFEVKPTGGTGDRRCRQPINPDWSIVRRIVRTMRGAISNADCCTEDLGSTGRRLHLPGVIVKDGDNFTRTSTKPDGKITMTVIIDMSGSMADTWTNAGGCEFVLALYKLHREGIIDVRCWLTRSWRCAKLPFARMSIGQICHIHPVSYSEGYVGTLDNADVSRDMADSLVTIAWSDGDLQDGDVSGPGLRRAGVDIIGCAPSERHVLDSRKLADLRKHFGRGYVGKVEQLARRIINYIIQGR